MAISNINLAMGASSYGAYNQKLTAATKAKLEELGIPYNPNISEQEGKALLAGHQAQKLNEENSAGANFNKNRQFAANDLLERARKLAQQLGIDFDESMPLNALLSLIEQALESKVNTAGNNEALLNKLKGFSEELASIQAQSIGATYDTTNKALEMSLEMLSLYNKNFLNN